MKIKDVNVTEIKPYELNNRKHPHTQVERIAKSIREFGFNQPLVVDENNVIIVGHGRLMAALELGLQSVPVVQLVNLTEVQKNAYRILDNKLQNDGEWDIDNLRVELLKLAEANFDLGGYGLNEFQKQLESGEIQASNYTRKIEAPVYEPKEPEPPSLSDVYNDLKVQILLAGIREAKIDEETRKFLTIAAYRHAVIDFEKAAEFYAHASKEVQNLMEESALVIVDFDKAIEQGFVEMIKSFISDMNDTGATDES